MLPTLLVLRRFAPPGRTCVRRQKHVARSRPKAYSTELQLEQSRGIAIEHFVRGRGVRTQPAHYRQLLRSTAFFPLTHGIIAIATVDQTILMALQEIACVVLVAQQGVQTGPRRKIAVQ